MWDGFTRATLLVICCIELRLLEGEGVTRSQGMRDEQPRIACGDASKKGKAKGPVARFYTRPHG